VNHNRWIDYLQQLANAGRTPGEAHQLIRGRESDRLVEPEAHEFSMLVEGP
jgi:hypothetical protein